jgi:hypothetical protein
MPGQISALKSAGITPRTDSGDPFIVGSLAYTEFYGEAPSASVLVQTGKAPAAQYVTTGLSTPTMTSTPEGGYEYQPPAPTPEQLPAGLDLAATIIPIAVIGGLFYLLSRR